jgi:hypothetical protein
MGEIHVSDEETSTVYTRESPRVIIAPV